MALNKSGGDAQGLTFFFWMYAQGLTWSSPGPYVRMCLVVLKRVKSVLQYVLALFGK
jgi:hypothetical protein